MTAYKNATSKKLKTQILSLYKYEHPASRLIEMNSSSEPLSQRQIKKARAHAKTFGPGAAVETTKKHRISMDRGKVNHFVLIINLLCNHTSIKMCPMEQEPLSLQVARD